MGRCSKIRRGIGDRMTWRIRGYVLVCRLLQRQRDDLWAVPVRDDQLVLLCNRCQVVTRHTDVGPLVLGCHRLTPAQQRVPAEGYHHSHARTPRLISPIPAAMTRLVWVPGTTYR